MDYEKKYKKLVGKIEKAYLYAQTDSTKAVLEEIRPELKESEDERIRKELINYFDKGKEYLSLCSIGKDDILAWLEKQKNCEYIRKDWLEHIKQSWYKEGFIDGKYTHKELTINDVTTLNELIDFLENGTAKLQHDLTLYANWLKTQFPPNEKQGKQKPTIEMKSAEESLGIDSETYNKIVDECIYGEQKSQRMVSAEAKEALYDKPACAWSEEDEHRVKDTIYFLDTAKKHYASTVELDACINWLKSLKERIGGE